MKLRHFLLLFSLLLFGGPLLSCKSSAPAIAETTKTVTVTETIRDTVFKVAADSSYYEAYLECVNGKVVATDVASRNSKAGFLQPPKVTLKDNKLSIDCTTLLQELKAQIKTLKTDSKTIEKVPVYIEKELTFWQRFFIWIGKISLFAIAAAIAWYLYKISHP